MTFEIAIDERFFFERIVNIIINENVSSNYDDIINNFELVASIFNH